MSDATRPPDGRLVAIHQPNFFPWLGYFDKIARADVFIVLDHVQFPKTRDGNWTNRVRLHAYGRPAWVTVPLVRGYEGFRRIDQMEISPRDPWRRKLLRLLQDSYGRTPHFREVFPVVRDLVENPVGLLAEYNLTAITALCSVLGIPTSHLVRSSTLDAEGGKTELLVGLVRGVGGTAYLAGGGAGGYQDDELFRRAGIDVVYQKYDPTAYAQRGRTTFLPGLSVLDALFHCGLEGTAPLVAGAPRPREGGPA